MLFRLTTTTMALATALLAGAPALAQATGGSRAAGGGSNGGDASSSSPFALRPEVGIEVQTGVNGYTGGLGSATHLGPSWQARAGLHLTEWLSFGAVYTGGYNAGRDAVVGPGVGLVNNGGYLSVSLIAPLPGRVRPYAGVGLGYGWTTVVGARGQSTPLQNSAGAFVPFGGGLDVELSDHWSLGLQLVYQRSIGGGSGGGSPLNEGDSWNTGLSLGYQL